ncbi:MAG: hypothetical protein KC549_14025 [Myxococcales bacterium]|nr:hypothetical protein [Myxococcales bacterium]
MVISHGGRFWHPAPMADLELVPDYYWRNLRMVVDTVLDAHPGLCKE